MHVVVSISTLLSKLHLSEHRHVRLLFFHIADTLHYLYKLHDYRYSQKAWYKENRLMLLILVARSSYFTFMRFRDPHMSKPFGLP